MIGRTHFLLKSPYPPGKGVKNAEITAFCVIPM